MGLAIKRIFAYWLDFMIVALLLISLQWLLYFTTSGFPFDYFEGGTVIELWVLATMSAPVWLYFIICEYRYQQTIGKRIMGLKVINNVGSKIRLKEAVVRTFIRLLPWEITHLIILIPEPWFEVKEPANFNLIYFPNLLIILYIVILFLNRGNLSLHDYISRTKVISSNDKVKNLYI